MKNILLILLLCLGSQAWANNLVIHEWGTFTSFMGSDGKLQEGLHEEDEPLPNFVYGVKNSQETIRFPGDILLPDDSCANQKICFPIGGFDFGVPLFGESLPVNPVQAGITQKMETPVIYFYGNVGDTVKVDIDFPEGIISQYYPRAESYSPKYTDLDTLGPSKFTFNVTLKDVFEESNIPFVDEDSIWMPARNVSANTIQVGNEQEKFIFYRGVANFDAKFQVISNRRDTLKLINNSSEKIRNTFVLYSDGVVGKVVPLGEFSDNYFVQAPVLDADSLPFNLYVQEAKSLIASALVDTGLFSDEAQAMVNTWERSYFHTPGLRVLYVVPDVETESILPMSVTPEPQSLVRTLIGRVEVMTANQEREYAKYLTSSDSVHDFKKIFSRFKEPKLKRLQQVISASKYNQIEKELALNRIGSLLNY